MSDLNVFATQAVSTTAKPQALSGAQSGVTAGTNIGFWNLLFNNILESNVTANTATKDGEGKNSALTTEELLNTAETLINNESLDKVSLDLSALQTALNGDTSNQAIEEQLSELKVERLVQFLDGLTNGTPQNPTNDINSNEGAESLLLLITSGLNPSEVSKVTQRIREVETKLGRELTLDDIVAGVGNILSSIQDTNNEAPSSDFLGVLLKSTDTTASESNKGSTSNDTTSQENVLENTALQSTSNQTGIDNADNQQTSNQIIQSLNHNSSKEFGTTSELTGLNSFDDTIPYEFGGILPKNNIPANDFIKNADLAGINLGKSKAGNGTLQNISLSTVSSLPKISTTAFINSGFADFSPDFFTDSFLINDGIEYNVQSGSPFNATMQAAHATSMTGQAGNTHPATQMVAAHIAKTAKGGDTQNITLQLDPPELGRVEVRLEFGADRSVTANLVVEKPETYLMLQRDANALEKALQDAGLETGSDSLNYDMAEDGYFSDKDGNRHGSGQQASRDNNGSNEEEIEIIETNMTWMVDPETGHMRYNIMA